MPSVSPFAASLLLLAAAFFAYCWRAAAGRERKLLQTLGERKSDLLRASGRLESANRHLERLASLDGLTGVANRALFEEVLDREWRRLTRYNLPLTLILLDIDCFTVYNESNSHRTGDECLRKLASYLAGAVNRPGDIVARYAADEFAVLLAGTDAAGGITVADTLRTGVATLAIPRASESADHVTICVGVATVVPWEGMNPAALVERTEWALSRARKRGTNRTEVYAA